MVGSDGWMRIWSCFVYSFMVALRKELISSVGKDTVVICHGVKVRGIRLMISEDNLSHDEVSSL